MGCEVCLRARPRLQNRLSPSAAKAARAHTLTTHPCTFTHSNAFIDTHAPMCFRDAGGDDCWPRSLSELPDGRGARGGARAAEKLITDLADYSGSLCYRRSHTNRTDFGPDNPGKSPPVPNWEWVIGSPRLGSPQLQTGGRPEVSQRGSGRRALRVASPLNPACLPGNTLALFPLQSPCNPKKRPHKFEGLKEPTVNSLINTSTL